MKNEGQVFCVEQPYEGATDKVRVQERMQYESRGLAGLFTNKYLFFTIVVCLQSNFHLRLIFYMRFVIEVGLRSTEYIRNGGGRSRATVLLALGRDAAVSRDT
jgi:hypothetical protein